MATYSSKFRVFQNWGAPNTGTDADQNVFVFGPRYSLHRYEDEDERAVIEPFEYVDHNEHTTLKAAIDTSANYDLDDASVALYAENAFVRLGEETGTEADLYGDQYSNVLVLKDKYVTREDQAEHELSFDLVRSVTAGDYVAIKKDDQETGTPVYSFVRITAVKTGTWNDESEYSNVAEGSVVTLEIGLPDGTVDENGNINDGVSVYFVTRLDSVKLNKDSFSVLGNDVVFYNQESQFYRAVNINGSDKPLLAGSLYVSYRSLYTGAFHGIDVMTSQASVESLLGKADPQNPISMGVFNAFVGGASTVYYYVTSGTSVDAFEKALELAELNKNLYYMVPMSQDVEVLNAVASHVKKMSTEEAKRWRIMVVCSPVSETETVDFKIVGQGTYAVDNARYVTLKIDTDFSLRTIDGDIVEAADGATYVAVRMLNSTTLLTHTSYTDGMTVRTGQAKLIHKLTNFEYAAAAGKTAASYGTFRVVDIFPKTYGFAGETYSSMFAAPLIAGMKEYIEPQAPITNKIIAGVDDLPDVYAKFSAVQLDKVAESGVLVMTQDMRSTPVYVRKQLTAGVVDGILAQAELSMVTNFDSVTKYFNNVIEGFKGAYNVTDSLIRRVRVALSNAIYHLSFNQNSELIGPQLLEGSRVEDIYQDPTNATRLIAHVVCVLPAPFNEMDLYLSVAVSTEVEATTEEA